LQTGGETRYFEVRTFPLCTARDEDAIGRAAILADTTAQARLLHELRQHADTDPLTGIANRRRFLEVLSQELLRAARYSLPLSMLMVDLDDFKLVNDQFGHPTGDSVLCAAVTRMAACLRTSDLLARFGGEEFAILLPVTGPAGAMEAAERIRSTLRNATVDVNGRSISITASIGVASLDKAKDDQTEHLIEQADQALYLAKAAGRDRIECWSEAPQRRGEEQLATPLP
jgi:diguanylate cyclase (GGDEF)-like protein